jgi:hypothetical protein
MNPDACYRGSAKLMYGIEEKPKYVEKSCPSATLSVTNSIKTPF